MSIISNKPEQRRKSSASSKRRFSVEENQADSLAESDDLLKELSTSIVLSEKPKINYQDELVLFFFNSMLDVIVEDWITIPDEPPQVCFCIDQQTETNDTTGEKGSKLSLTGKPPIRRSSPDSKDSRRSKDSGHQELLRRKRSKSGERPKSPSLRESIDQRSKTSVKRRSKDSAKSGSKKSRASTFSHDSSRFTCLDWILDSPDENTIIIFKNGNRYEGPVTRKLMHGFGKFIWADGTAYEGDFVHGHATGHGMLQYSDLSFYHGDFCKSLLHGEGVFNMKGTPMLYTGRWKASEKHGNGWLLYETGDWYEGEWFEDQRQGMGYRQYKNGARYKGQWYQGKQHGQGTMVWPNNDIYRGEWVNGIMNGYGKYVWNAFLNDTFTYPEENVYEGNWVDGKREGTGILNFGTQNGAQLAGIWKNNMKHGAGVLQCGNGKLVERNPLFWCDKPIHLDIEADPGYPRTAFLQSHRVTPETSMHDVTPHCHHSIFQLIVGQVRSRGEGKALNPSILELIDRDQPRMNYPGDSDSSQSDFLSGRNLCSPLPVPMHLAAEQTDFSYYIERAVHVYTGELYKGELSSDLSECASGDIRADTYPSWVSKYSKWNILSHLINLSRSYLGSPGRMLQSPSDLQSRLANLQARQVVLEEKELKDTIVTHLTNLHKLYNKYATIASPHTVSFKPILIRYFLWQMIRDLNIVNDKYTLVDIDIILISNPGSGLKLEHYPFEKIYFWQYLQILISLAWLLHSPRDVTEACKNSGILSTILKKFLQDVVYKNMQSTYSGSLFEFRDLLPVNSVYSLYCRLGEPHTARKFLNSVCTRKREQPPCYLKIFKDEKTPKLARGTNAVPVGGKIIYLPNASPDFGEKPSEPEPEPSTNDPFRKELFILRSLGSKKVVECLISVCPQIVKEGVIVNMEYPLTFLEFYDVFLMCGFLVVEKAKKKEERMRLQEERRTLFEIDLHTRSMSVQKPGKSKDKLAKAKK